jgi:predicted GNAT superfamily acetyltransferase
MIEIRALHTVEEMNEAVCLQQLIWVFTDYELIPVRLFVTASKVGGQVFGAFDQGRMIGFCMAIPGIKQPGNRSYLHSHMLGVMKEYRDAGVGRMLKLEQRKEALSRSLGLMEWTFDPLEIKNAYFNIERLGAIVPRYVLNQYGTTSSKLHYGLPTDRCVAAWLLDSARVETILAGGQPERPASVASISVPSEIYEIKANDPARARDIQQRVSDQFMEHISKGLAVTAFHRTPEAGTYIFTALHTTSWDSK